MGQDMSNPVDVAEDTPCHTLEDRSLSSIARYILSGNAKNIVVMVGAGVSTSAGIPDFRSPETGLYANLARLSLPYAEAVFDISYFRGNPDPFYCLAHELYPGKYRPTISHVFIEMLARKGILLKLFTQNIDCLDRQAGADIKNCAVPAHKIIEAHGSFATQRCIECKLPYADDKMQACISRSTVPRCEHENCQGLVKPDIVFFGEALPSTFHKNRMLPSEADLCIIMGTSLTVQPFASLPQICSEGTPRLLINRERVGGLGSRSDDVVLIDYCDNGIRRLAEALGWIEELESAWRRTIGDQVAADHKLNTASDSLEQRVDKLAEEIDDSLKISREHQEHLEAFTSLASDRENK